MCPQPLRAPLKVSIRKSRVFATYPLQYLRAFNAAPHELIEVTGLGKAQRTCKDKSTDGFPTCGWTLSTSTGERLLDSQGFCCGCSMSNAIDQSIDGSIDGSGMTAGGGSEFRANLDCNVFRTGLPLQAGAHCMRHGDDWYSGYSVGASRMDFDVFIDVSVGNDDVETAIGHNQHAQDGPTVSSLRLGPDVLINRTDDGLVMAELLGDLVHYTSVPTLSDKLLMVPPLDVAGSLPPVHEWLLLDKGMVTLDGSECDKVGVGFSAFRGQPMRCFRAPGSCLRNQIVDILSEERERTDASRQPLYLLSQFGHGVGTTRSSSAEQRQGGDRVVLRVPIETTANSVLTLTLDARDLVQTINTSPGAILRAIVTGFSPSVASAWEGSNATDADGFAGGFEALSASGRVIVEIVNTGNIPAEYHVTVTNCTEGVARVVSPGPITLVPLSPRALALTVEVDSQAEDASRSCSLQLLDAIGIEIDSRLLSFYTNATVLDDAPNEMVIVNPNSEFAGPNAQRQKLTCADRCPSTSPLPPFPLAFEYPVIPSLLDHVLKLAIERVLRLSCARSLPRTLCRIAPLNGGGTWPPRRLQHSLPARSPLWKAAGVSCVAACDPRNAAHELAVPRSSCRMLWGAPLAPRRQRQRQERLEEKEEATEAAVSWPHVRPR